MTGSPEPAALSAAETRAAGALLARALGEETPISAAEPIWDRGHVVRLHLESGRSAVLKRRGGLDRRRRGRSFGAELAALEFLSAMPEPIAPRLLGADTRAGILVMEDLPPGPSLADSLLTGERERARADLVAYARALGSLHTWSMGRAAGLADLRARYAPAAPAGPWLERAVKRGKQPFLAAAAALGLGTGGAAREIGELPALLSGTSPSGMVHGDACPDNVRLLGDGCRIFDFETSSWGPVVLDAAYLLAPFPSCWCFASLPADAAAPALEAYRGCLRAAGIDPGPDWDAAVAAALAWWLIARGEWLAGLPEEDPEWGTTTLRPRVLAWLRSFTGQAGKAGVLPRLRALTAALDDQLSRRWPGLVIPDYPALAQPGSPLARVPGGWQPGQ
jgi:hypothetical protein